LAAARARHLGAPASEPHQRAAGLRHAGCVSPRGGCRHAGLERRSVRRALLFEPGHGWSYSNPGYWLLGRIVERESGTALGTAIERLITGPLGLDATRLVHGRFAPDLPDYPAGWVWHGLLLGSAADTARFMASAQIARLARELQPVPGHHPPWRSPHYGLGVMVEPGERYGHNGGGPGYSASCFHFPGTGRTLCVLARSDEEDAAMHELLALADADPNGAVTAGD
jgi:D-alanyl-D-alanine carboxypeptidase